MFGQSAVVNSALVNHNRSTLAPLEAEKLSKSMASKIAAAGLNYGHLQTAFER